jgi:site-specific DNA-cytosine methylase
MKVALDICCGYGGGTQAFRGQKDWLVIGIDADGKFRSSWQGGNLRFVQGDIIKIDWQKFLEEQRLKKVDFIWESPPCTHYSWANPKWPRQGIQKQMEIVGACFEAVAVLKPRYWLIENPRGRLQKLCPLKPTATIFYSDFDENYPVQKPTNLWGNVPLAMVKQTRRPPSPRHTFMLDKKLGRDPAKRGFVPFGVSNAVFEAVSR